MSRRTTVEMVAAVSPVARVSSTRLIVPAARMRSRIADRLLACAAPRPGWEPLTSPPPWGVPLVAHHNDLGTAWVL